MPPLYRIAEASIYSLLNFLPFLVLAIFPFRHSLRFSPRTTGVLIGLLTVIQLALGFWAGFYSGGKSGLISAVSTVLYTAFYFLAIKKHLGKVLFTLLMISNIANLAVVSAKCIEGQLFPELAVQNYRWSFSLMLFAVELLIYIPLVQYLKRVYTPAIDREPSGLEWHYLWLIPATFYMMWYYAIYFNASRSSLEIALRPGNAIFLLVINTGATLIYYIVARLVLEQGKSTALQENNHMLTMQAMQYENLQDRINEARRAKHDVRHHITLMQEYLASGDYEALGDYLSRYRHSLPDDTLVRFCENSAVNAVLLYFAQQAKDARIDYVVNAVIPELPRAASCAAEPTENNGGTAPSHNAGSHSAPPKSRKAASSIKNTEAVDAPTITSNASEKLSSSRSTPRDRCGIDDTDLSVLFGNLLENALEACRAESADGRKIIVHASVDGGALCLTVDNTYTGNLRRLPDGALISTKHHGLGLGTKSVRSIAEKCGGICRFETKDGMFYASVMCPLGIE